MPQPKQIIYPLRYLRPLMGGIGESEARFERGFSSLVGGEVSVVPLGRARAGIYLLAKLAIAEERRRVILSPYTIPDVINMVRFAGGEPVFVDCLEASTNIDLGHLAELIDGRTACVIITHYHVNQNQTAEIRRLCRERDVKCFDDCALAVGAALPGERIGRATDASVFSLSAFKTLNFLWGGAITTRSGALADSLRRIVETWPRLTVPQYAKQMMRTLKYDLATRRALFSRIVFPVYRRKILSSEVQDVLPVSRIESLSMDATVASRPALGAFEEWNRKIGSVEASLRHRRHIAGIYDRYFRHRAVSGETSDDVRRGSCHVNYPIFVGQALRNDIYKDILSRGYDVGLSLYPNVHETAGFTGIEGRSDNVSVLVRSVITLPTHPRISEPYAARLAESAALTLSRHGLN